MKTCLYFSPAWRTFPSLWIVIAILGLLTVTSVGGALDLGSPTGHTPYDAYLGPMWAVLRRLAGNQPDMALVNKLMSEDRAFRYSYSKDQPYVPQTPDVTEATHSGDCKAKALWLASKMDSRSVRFVIGKASASRAMNHAWLIWQGPEGWLILDATMLSRPLSPERCSPTEYIPTYSYSPDGKYAHAGVSAAVSKYGDHL
jgi:hypothetical protein